MNTTMTKTIAHKTGRTTAGVNEIVRDLNLPRTYEARRNSWTVPSTIAKQLIAELNEAK